MQKLHVIRYFSVVLALMFLMACANGVNKSEIIETGYKTLSSLGTVYDSTMKSLSAANKTGTISDAKWAEIKSQYAQKFYDAYHDAVDALHAYSIDPSAETKATWESNLSLVSRALDLVVNLAEPFITK